MSLHDVKEDDELRRLREQEAQVRAKREADYEARKLADAKNYYRECIRAMGEKPIA